MIGSLLTLLTFQLIGEIFVRALTLPIPGPVIGMMLLFVVLMLRGRSWPAVDRTANTLLRHLSLLFVPAGVGVVTYLSLLGRHWLAITVTLIASTLIALIVTALVMQTLMQLRRHRSARS